VAAAGSDIDEMSAGYGRRLLAGVHQKLRPRTEVHPNLGPARHRLNDPFAERRVQQTVAGLVGLAGIEGPRRSREIGLDDQLVTRGSGTRGGAPPWSPHPIEPLDALARRRPKAVPRAALLAFDLCNPARGPRDDDVPDVAALATQGTDIASNLRLHVASANLKATPRSGERKLAALSPASVWIRPRIEKKPRLGVDVPVAALLRGPT